MRHLLNSPLFSLTIFALIDAGHKAVRAGKEDRFISTLLYGLAACVLFFVLALFLLGII